MHKFWNELGHLRRGMWQTRHTPGQVMVKPQDGWNRPTGWNVKRPAIRAWGQYHSRVLETGECGLAAKAPQRKRPCRSRATARRSLIRHACVKHQRASRVCAVRSQIVLKPEIGVAAGRGSRV